MKKRGSVFKKMLLSYVLIFTIPILLGLAFYAYSYRINMEQVKSSNENLLKTIRSTCDGELSYYKRLLLQISGDEKVGFLTGASEKLSGNDRWNMSVICENLQSRLFYINVSDSLCKDVFVYYRHLDRVLSTNGSMYLDEYFNVFCAGTEEEKERLRAQLEKYHFSDLVNLENDWRDGAEVLLMTNWVMGMNAIKNGSVAGVWLDAEDLRSKVEDTGWNDDIAWAMIDKSNRLIIGPEGAEVLTLDYESLGGEKNVQIDWKDTKYIINSLDSKVMGLKYVLMIPEKVISQPAGKQRNFFMAGLIGCMIMGYWLITKMLKMNYNPLQNIMELFDKQGKNEDLQDEYQYLRNKTLTLLSEKKELGNAMKQSSKAAKQYYLIHFLTSSCDEKSINYGQTYISETFRRGKNVVLLLRIRRTTEEENETKIEDDLEQFIVQNVLEELISTEFSVETVLLGNKNAMIVHVGEKSDYESVLHAQTDVGNNFLAENFKFTVTACVSAAHEGIKGIHEAYMEACEIEKFMPSLEEDFISYGEIGENTSLVYRYSSDMEMNIVEALKAHNAPLAVSLVNKVLDENLKENKIAPEMRKGLLYVLFATLLKTAEEMNKGVEEVMLLSELFNSTSIKKLRVRFQEAIEKICEKEETKEEDTKLKTLCDRVLEYIKQNYNDPDLNISQVAHFLGITPAYLSSLYKKQTGESLLSQINYIRVKEAKKLLIEGRSVVEVTELAGFRDSSTFIRTFKRYEGITPGQLCNAEKK